MTILSPSIRFLARLLGSILRWSICCFFFFFNDTATTEIYTLSLHDALPISPSARSSSNRCNSCWPPSPASMGRSEEHTSELQSLAYLVCRLLLEKKNNIDVHHRREALETDVGHDVEEHLVL